MTSHRSARFAIRSLGLAAGFLALVPFAKAEEKDDDSSSKKRGPQLMRMERMKFERQLSRDASDVRDALKPVVAKTARSTARVMVDGHFTALATAVHAEGWLLSKASELLEHPNAIEVEFSNGLRLPAKISDSLEPYDLALLKVEAKGLQAVDWAVGEAPEPGSFLAAPTPSGDVAALGVSSVAPRSLYEPPQGYLGIQMDRGSELPIVDVVAEGSGAEKAGLKKGDLLLAVEGSDVATSSAVTTRIRGRRPGSSIKLKVRRGMDEMDITAMLGDRKKALANRHEDVVDPTLLMSGRLSTTRDGFLNVFQHDLMLRPEFCGGPLVNLGGEVVGVDIARSGRVESLAIPANDLRSLLAKVTSGKFSLPDLDQLRDDIKKAELAIARAQAARGAAEVALERAKVLHDSLPPASMPVQGPPAPPSPVDAKPAPASAVQP